MKKIILKIMLGSVILEAVLVCILILIGKIGDEVTWRSLGSVGVIFVYTFPCLAYARIYDNDEYKNIAIAGAVIASISALIDILGFWDLIPEGESITKIESSLHVAVLMITFISWSLSYPSINNLLSLFKKINVSLATILGFMSILFIWTVFPTGFLARIFAVFIVLTTGSYACTSILAKIYKKELMRKEQEEIVRTNPNFAPQTNIAQPQFTNNPVQTQPVPQTPPMMNPQPSTNPMGTVPTNPLNNETMVNNGEPGNNMPQ